MAEYKSIWTGKQVDNAVGEVANKLSKPTNDASGEVGWGLVKTADGSEWAKIEVAADLNSLEAKLNENIIKDPSKTYLAVKGSQIPPDSAFQKMLVMPANSSVDWGDGTVETYDGKTTLGHIYKDNVEYHLVTISGLTGIPSNMFQDWGCVIDVSLANNITTLGTAAFLISGIKTLVIPASVTQIDTMAVGGLSSVIMKGSTPPTLSTDVPLSIDKTIIVPKSAINTYKSASGWSEYADKIVYEVDSSDLPDMDAYVDKTSSQTIIGKKEFSKVLFYDSPDSYNGYNAGNPSQTYYTRYGNRVIDFYKTSDNSHYGSISFPLVEGDLNSFALKSDIVSTDIENGTGTKAVQQKQDGTSGTFDFTDKNPNATAIDSTLTGQIAYGATGNFSASFGGKGAAQGKRSFQAGTTTIAKGNYSAAFGDNSVALGNDSFTANYENVSSGLASASFGQNTLAGGEASFTEGTGSAVRSVIPTTSSSGSSSGDSSTGSGTVTQPDDWEDNNHLGNSTHVEGRGCVGYGVATHVGGAFNTGYGHRAYVGGSVSRVGTTTQDAGNTLVVKGGTNSFAHGKMLVVEGNQSGSFGEGNNVLADSAFSAGFNNYIGQNATGSATVGSNNNILGPNSFAAGLSNDISAETGFAAGYSNTVSGKYSGAVGVGLTANALNQFVVGKYNKLSDSLFIVGGGSLSSLTNLFEVVNDGRAKVQTAPKENNDVVRKYELDTKYDKTGGTISGNVAITGDLTVNGTEHINNVENLNVKNAMIYSNADGATLAQNGGIGIKTNTSDVYGIVYDPTSDSVKLGLGKSDTNGKFTFNTGEGQPVAIRDDSSKLTNGHLVQWDGTNHKLVDGGAKPDLSNYVDLNSEQIISGAKTFSSSVKVTSDIETEYTNYYNTGIYEHSGTNSWYYTFPRKEGIFALTSDIPDTSNFANTNDANNFKQTITVGDSLTATSRVDIDKGFVKVISAKGMTIYNQGSISNMSGVLTLPEKTGTLALTSDVATKSSFSVEVW